MFWFLALYLGINNAAQNVGERGVEAIKTSGDALKVAALKAADKLAAAAIKSSSLHGQIMAAALIKGANEMREAAIESTNRIAIALETSSNRAIDAFRESHEDFQKEVQTFNKTVKMAPWILGLIVGMAVILGSVLISASINPQGVMSISHRLHRIFSAETYNMVHLVYAAITPFVVYRLLRWKMQSDLEKAAATLRSYRIEADLLEVKANQLNLESALFRGRNGQGTVQNPSNNTWLLYLQQVGHRNIEKIEVGTNESRPQRFWRETINEELKQFGEVKQSCLIPAGILRQEKRHMVPVTASNTGLCVNTWDPACNGGTIHTRGFESDNQRYAGYIAYYFLPPIPEPELEW